MDELQRNGSAMRAQALLAEGHSLRAVARQLAVHPSASARTRHGLG